MSDNVIEIFETEEPPRMSLKKQWIIFISIVVMIVLLLSWFLYTQTTVLDGVKRFFRYMGVDENAYGNIRFEAYGEASFAMTESAFAVASLNGVQLFTANGSTLISLSANFTHPVFDTCDDRMLLYDIGGERVVLIDPSGEVLFDLSTEGRIFDADLNEDGSCAVLYEGSDCYAVLDVLDAKGAKLFSHRSESAFLNTCAISPDGSYVAVTTLGQEDISFLSTLRILSTSSEEVHSTVSLGTQLISDMAFLDDERVCAIGEDTLFFAETDGSVEEEYVGESAEIAGYCFTQSDVMVVYDQYDLSLGYELVRLSAEGEKEASTRLSGLPTYFSRCDSYLCLLTQEEVLIYDHGLNLRSSKAQEAYLAALAREDGTALCIANGRAELYIP